MVDGRFLLSCAPKSEVLSGGIGNRRNLSGVRSCPVPNQSTRLEDVLIGNSFDSPPRPILGLRTGRWRSSSAPDNYLLIEDQQN
jgi:hypothetical protein